MVSRFARRWLLASTLCVACIGSAAGRLHPSRGVVFPVERIGTLRLHCSRPSPDSVVGFWTPDSATVGALEQALAPVLGAALARAGPARHRPRVSAYYRQYGGLIIANGRRVVYINGFHESSIDPDVTSRELQAGGGWRELRISACDGGWYYFGAVYDPASGRISEFHFNGPL